jgi:thiamine biosynthesis lipoprotein ApbE
MFKAMKVLLKPKKIKIKWRIEGFPDLFFGEDKKLYSLSTLREVKLTLNGYTKGYYIDRKFYSLHKLRPLITKIDV